MVDFHPEHLTQAVVFVYGLVNVNGHISKGVAQSWKSVYLCLIIKENCVWDYRLFHLCKTDRPEDTYNTSMDTNVEEKTRVCNEDTFVIRKYADDKVGRRHGMN